MIKILTAVLLAVGCAGAALALAPAAPYGEPMPLDTAKKAVAAAEAEAAQHGLGM